MKKNFAEVGKLIERDRESMAKTLARMISIKAISPANGGSGEEKRADFLQSLLENWGLKVRRYTYADESKTKRPNLVVKLGGQRRTVWTIAHTDTVAEGDRSLWKTDPFKAKITKEKVFGRGANDDGQEVIASIFALKALKEAGVSLRHNLGIVLAADEENGSVYGVRRLVKEGLFKENDMILVPDIGNSKGDEIEIGEKTILWLKITVLGKQVHASTPDEGENAYRNAIRFLNDVDTYLHKKYNARDSLFDVPSSTFEMTKHEKNVDNVNIIPGTEVSYIDCRILPRYSTRGVLNDIKKIARGKKFRKVKIAIEIVDMEEAPPTSRNAEIVVSLKRALRELRGINARCIGVGGGSVAKPIRNLGMPVAAWCTENDMAHRPNEYADIDFMVEDAKVFAYLCL